MGWLQKQLVKRWIKELEENVRGLRRMGEDYKSMGGFKEVAETIEKLGATDVFPKELLEQGRQVELKFAEACIELAECYQQLLDFVKKIVEK
jgi:hypothetical protein